MQSAETIEYKKTVSAVALGLLLHTALADLSPALKYAMETLFLHIGLKEGGNGIYAANAVIGIIIYVAIFLIPTLFIFRYAPAPTARISFDLRFPKGFAYLLPLTVGCITAAGHFTGAITEMLNRLGVGFKSYAPELPDNAVGILLLFISSAAVPAVTEELLFRKAVLERFSHYGNGFAIILSAVLFALMHANPTQMLYAFAGGLLMGYVTLECGSIIPAVLIHFANNALSLIYLIVERYASRTAFIYTVTITDTVLCAFGIIGLMCISKKLLAFLEKKPSVERPTLSQRGVNVFLIGYVAYTLYLSARWIYFI